MDNRIDPRGPRFAAAVTSVLLILALVLGPPWGLLPLGIQFLAFAAGALLGVHRQPWGWVFRRFVRPRLAAPAVLEDPRPPRFAQAVGLGFAAVALIGGLLGATPVLLVATGFAPVAALLNAVFDFCLGCEVYLRVQRLRRRNLAVTP
ncbi:MAG: DUF4395 domain-containing protein [Actinobacteria bacterium]|nr:DUF4395 domain-containing protein [Actinomycetota bacterium]